MSTRNPEHLSPYVIGARISLSLDNGVCVEATVVGLKTFTLSCVVVVQVQHDDFPDQCIVKLYDRRFSTQLRSDYDAAPWDTSLENEYQKYVLNGKIGRMFAYWTEESEEDVNWNEPLCKNWDAVETEAYLQFVSWTSYKTETHAYHLMADLQGHSVPKLFGESTKIFASPSGLGSSKHGELLGCPGIVLQLIDGFPLTDLGDKLRPEFWQATCQNAIDIVLAIGERGICNQDVNTRSFIVQGRDNEEAFDVFMVDFGQCLFRDQARNRTEFEIWQAVQDEEGAVGLVMQKYLKGGFQFRCSARAEYLSNKYMTEQASLNHEKMIVDNDSI